MIDLLTCIIIIALLIETLMLTFNISTAKYLTKFFKNTTVFYIVFFLSLYITLALVAWHIGAYQRGEISPVPWIEFTRQFAEYGLSSGLLAMFTVIIVDLWIFWTASTLWIIYHQETDKHKIILIRIINISVGIILTT